MDIIKEITKNQLKKEIPDIRIGDRVRVEEKIVEQDKVRIQTFEGIVIAKKGGGISETFTVRKISYGVGVEKTYPLHSPLIQKITIIRRGKVRRAKLYYLRKKIGKAARVEEKEGVKEETAEEDVLLGKEAEEEV